VKAGKINHYFVFFQWDDSPLMDLQYAYGRWVYVIEEVGARYRDPYNARHSYISLVGASW